MNGKPVARKDDMSDHHKCGPDRHDGSMDGGGSVFANGKVMQRVIAHSPQDLGMFL